ncbi:MAG: TIGR02996 domain-containing protein [Planctomycetes bacterium]|nr:TIGR02996 domain-containing protein [Planctomycetota bacterium]
MHDETGFLRKLLEDPADDTTRLVYADWLDERGGSLSTAKSQFLRITASLLEQNRSAHWRKLKRKELQPLAATLPTDWLAVVSRLKVEQCGNKRAIAPEHDQVRELFDTVCDKRWDEMIPTDSDTVRFCERCQEAVHYCDTIVTAREHAQRGHCVAVDLGIIRREADLDPPSRGLRMGRISFDRLQQLRRKQLERGADDVSLAREQAKRDRERIPPPERS